MCTSEPREFREPGLWYFSAQFGRGFVLCANLRNTCWSFYRGKCQSPQISAILRKRLPQQMRRQTSKSWLAKLPIRNLDGFTTEASPIHKHVYTQFPSQDSGLFGPNPWKILAPPSNYLSNKVSGQPTLGKSLVRENLVMGTGCTCVPRLRREERRADQRHQGRREPLKYVYTNVCMYVCIYIYIYTHITIILSLSIYI